MADKRKPVRKTITAVIRGRRYRVKFCKLKNNWGECDWPTVPGKEIRLAKDLKGIELLDTAIHECLHAAHHDLDEHAINSTASDIARFLWRLGYRRAIE